MLDAKKWSNMPAEFDKCQKGGGKIRTKRLGGRKFIHICILGGKTYGGEVRIKKVKK